MSLEYRDGHFVDPQKLTQKHSRITPRRTAAGVLAAVLAVAGVGSLDKGSGQTVQLKDSTPSPSIGLVSTPRIETASPIPSLVATAEPSFGQVNSSLPAIAETASPTSSETPAEMGSFITLGNESDLSLESQRLIYTPDGHIPYITFSDGTRRYFITADVSTYAIDTNGETLQQAIQGKRATVDPNKPVYSSEQNTDYSYSGITSVFGLDANNQQHLTGIIHEEKRVAPDNSKGIIGSVAKIESFDGGLSWTNQQVLITGDNPAVNPGGESYSGAGEPDAIQIGDYLYIYHIDWSQGEHSDQIYLARTNIANGTIDGNVEFYTNNGFVAGQDSDLKPVIPVFTTDDPHDYTGLPSVSWNKDLNKYLMVFETNNGFAQTTSTDGITWETPKIFANFPQSQFDRQTMDDWFSYPTLVSDDSQLDDHVTTKNGTLYYSKGIWKAKYHELVSRDYSLK